MPPSLVVLPKQKLLSSEAQRCGLLSHNSSNPYHSDSSCPDLFRGISCLSTVIGAVSLILGDELISGAMYSSEVGRPGGICARL